MKKLLYIFLIVVLHAQFTDAQGRRFFKFRNKKVTGIEKIKNNQDSADIFNSINSLLDSYYRKGYISARTDSIINDSNYINVYYYKGDLVKWGKLSIKNLDEEILKRQGLNVNSFTGKPFILKNLFQLIDKIIRYYENNGYPFIKVELVPISFQKNEIYAELVFNKYDLFIIDSVIIKGYSSINYKILNKIINIKPGEIYNEQTISKISERINNAEFISEGKPNELEFSAKKVSIYTYIKKEKANSIDGIIGFLPNNKTTGKLLVTGEANLVLLNSLKKAETILFNWRKFESTSQELNFNLVYPYILYSDIGADISLSLFKKDSSYLNIESIIGMRYQLGGGNYLKLYYQKNSSNVLKQNTEFTNLNFKSTTSNLVGLGYFYVNLDYKYNPRRGFELKSDFGVGKKQITNENSGKYIKSKVDFDGKLYFPLIKKFVIKIQNRSSLLIDDNLYENELSLIGGFNNLRGFDEKSIQTSLFTISTFELRYLFEKKSNVYLFYDICYYEKKINEN